MLRAKALALFVFGQFYEKSNPIGIGLSMYSEDTDLYRSAMNEDELINFLGQVELGLHPTP
jgi:hypothetical protein